MKSYILAGALVGAMLVSPLAYSQDVLPQLEEAKSFFTRIAQQTNNPYIASMARENLKNLDHNAGRPKLKIEVPLVAGYDSLAVPVLLNRVTPGRFIVDTGATHTVITPQAARRLGVVIDGNTPTVTLLTANGRVQAPFVTLQELSIGDARVRNIQVIVQDLGGDSMLSGLLGMNFFKDRNLQILNDKLVLEVDPQDRLTEENAARTIAGF